MRKSQELKRMGAGSAQDWEQKLTQPERELLKEMVLATREIRYGSIVLTIHDGRIVEVSKTERVRSNPG
jgi:hypothetical protein